MPPAQSESGTSLRCFSFTVSVERSCASKQVLPARPHTEVYGPGATGKSPSPAGSKACPTGANGYASQQLHNQTKSPEQPMSLWAENQAARFTWSATAERTP